MKSIAEDGAGTQGTWHKSMWVNLCRATITLRCMKQSSHPNISNLGVLCGSDEVYLTRWEQKCIKTDTALEVSPTVIK